VPLRQNEAMLIQRGLDSYDSGKNGEDCGAAHLDGAAVAMVHARMATAGRAHGGRLLGPATHWLGTTQHRPGEWPELKQKKQRCEYLHSSIVPLAQRLDKAGLLCSPEHRPAGPHGASPLCPIVTHNSAWTSAGWTRPGSNRRPPRCKRGALPAELRAHASSAASTALLVQTSGFQTENNPACTAGALPAELPPQKDRTAEKIPGRAGRRNRPARPRRSLFVVLQRDPQLVDRGVHRSQRIGTVPAEIVGRVLEVALGRLQ
jgi:hypothetical protein